MKRFPLLPILVYLIGCSAKEVDRFRTHEILSESPNDKLILKLPKNYKDILNISENETDTLLLTLYGVQENFPFSYVFYDSANFNNYIIIQSGMRVDIGKRRDPALMKVPRIPFSRVFPDEEEGCQIIAEIREAKFGRKTYYMRKYKLFQEGQIRFQTIYHISTTTQSTLIQVVDNREQTNQLDSLFLSMNVVKL